MKTRLTLIPILALVLVLTTVVILPQIIEAKRAHPDAVVPEPTAMVQPLMQGKSDVVSDISVRNDTSIPVREMKQKPIERKGERELNENPKIKHVHKDSPDASVQRSLTGPNIFTPNMPSVDQNFEGIGFPGVSCNCAPP
jgi:hypothetical protein